MKNKQPRKNKEISFFFQQRKFFTEKKLRCSIEMEMVVYGLLRCPAEYKVHAIDNVK